MHDGECLLRIQTRKGLNQKSNHQEFTKTEIEKIFVLTKATAKPEALFAKESKCRRNWNVQFNSNNRIVKE